jgi:LysR family hydrogen peroxide-inducible transcriptional activator
MSRKKKEDNAAGRPSIRQLEYFLAVARASGFRGAAEKLKVTQPTLTLQIAALEEQLGIQLFDRSRAGTLLSPAGREFMPLARDILEHYRLLDEFTRGNSSEDLVGTYRLGVSPTIAGWLLPRMMPVLHERYPQLKLHVMEAVPRDLEAGLDAGTFDLILTVLPMQAGNNRIRPLFTEPLQVVMPASHPLAKKNKLLGRDLHQHSILGIDAAHHLHRQISSFCERNGARLLSQYEGNSLTSLQLMLMMGMGLAILPALYVQQALAGNTRIKVYNVGDETLERTHIAAWRKHSSARHLFQKLSFEIKSIAMELYGDVLEEVLTDEAFGEGW